MKKHRIQKGPVSFLKKYIYEICIPQMDIMLYTIKAIIILLFFATVG